MHIGFIQNFLGKIISKNNQTKYELSVSFFIQLRCIKCIKNCYIGMYFWFRTICFSVYLIVNFSMLSQQTMF